MSDGVHAHRNTTDHLSSAATPDASQELVIARRGVATSSAWYSQTPERVGIAMCISPKGERVSVRRKDPPASTGNAQYVDDRRYLYCTGEEFSKFRPVGGMLGQSVPGLRPLTKPLPQALQGRRLFGKPLPDCIRLTNGMGLFVESRQCSDTPPIGAKSQSSSRLACSPPPNAICYLCSWLGTFVLTHPALGLKDAKSPTPQVLAMMYPLTHYTVFVLARRDGRRSGQSNMNCCNCRRGEGLVAFPEPPL